MVPDQDIHHSVRDRRISIVLAHYNGTAFIESQIQSIIDQTHKNWKLVIYDDCSEPRAAEKLLVLQDHFNNQFSIVTRSNNLGYCKNFLRGLKDIGGEADFFAYCDQDDVWHDDKIDRAIDSLIHYPTDKPLLYCSRTELLDNQTNMITGMSPLFTKPSSFRNALTQNIAGGNTMVFNKVARELIVAASEGVNLVSHDWWTYILVTGSGGTVVYDPVPSVKYRQHSENSVGSNIGVVSRTKRLIGMLEGKLRIWTDMHLFALSQHVQVLTDENKILVQNISIARDSSFPLRLWRFLSLGLYRQTLSGTVALVAAVLFKKI